jgi:hypothetical protein
LMKPQSSNQCLMGANRKADAFRRNLGDVRIRGVTGQKGGSQLLMTNQIMRESHDMQTAHTALMKSEGKTGQ